MVDLAGVGSLLSGLSSIGGLFGGGGLSPRKAAALEFEYNKQTMQNQLQWRVEDAKKAGIHPLAAIGAPMATFAPQVVGGESVGDKLAQAGHGVARAATAYSDDRARVALADQERRLNEAKIQNIELENAKTASEISLMRTGATVPINSPGDMIVDGQGNSSRVNIVPSRQETNLRANRGIAAGIPPGTKAYVMPDGHTMLLPSQEAAEAMESSEIYGLEHYLRNRVIAPLLWGGRKVASAYMRRVRRNYQYDH